MPALNLVDARGLKDVLKHTAGKVAHVEIDGQRLCPAAVERHDKDAGLLLLIEHVVARADRARVGDDVARPVEGQDVARAQSIVPVAHGNEARHPVADL